MAFADDVAALQAQAQQLTTDAQQAEADLQAAIDAIPDLSSLKTALGSLGAAVDSVEALKAAALSALSSTSGTTPSPDPAPTPDPAPAELAVYTFAGDPSTIDASAWPSADVETAETTPRPLYHYAGDTNPGDQNGNGLDGGLWVLYDGPTQPIPAA